MSEEMKNLNNEPEQAPVEKEEAKKPLDKKNIIIIAAAAVVVVVAIVLALVLGGGNQPADNNGGNDNGGENGGEEGGETLNEYYLGMGTVVNLDSSKTGTAQLDVTVATVVVDASGKIVACRIDVAQNKVDITDGYVTVPSEFKTKMELGSAYGMGQPEPLPADKAWMDNNGDGKVLEWNEQAKAFEAWCVGKTLAQVKNLIAEGNLNNVNGHWISTDADLLAAGCTIQISEFVNAVEKAFNDDQKATFKSNGEFTLGLGVDSYDDGSADAEDEDGVVKVYSNMAAVVKAGDKTLAVLNDAIQPTISFDIAGDITAKTFKGTKRELKEDYGMGGKPYSPDNDGDGRVLEWYVQSAAFSAHVTGKTVAEIEALGADENLQNKNDHWITTDADLLAAGCTIQIGAIVDVVVEAANNAR